MNINSLENAANAINKRIDNLIKNFGANSAAVKQYETMINANFKGATFSTKEGVLHISRSKSKLAAVKNTTVKFEKMFNAPTVGSVTARAKMQLQEQGNESPTREEIRAQVEVSDNAEDIIRNNAYKYDMYDDMGLKYAKETLRAQGRRKTWDEINRIVEILKRDYADKTIKEPVNEFADLEGLHR